MNKSSGFTLVEVLVAAAISAMLMAEVSQLFVAALDVQRQATAMQKVQENAQFVIESIAREVRVSKITSVSATALVLEHPVNGTVTYAYTISRTSGGHLTRNAEGSGAQKITSDDVTFTAFQFIPTGVGSDGLQARITMPMTISATMGRQTAAISLQTTATSRNIYDEVAQ